MLSIIVPIFNEQDNIPVIYQALTDLLKKYIQNYDYEIIFVDDGSFDASWQTIKNLSYDFHIKAIQLSRNFGHQNALMAGYHVVRGDAVITIDADMQHPPEYINAMIEKWEAGVSIVYARRIKRDEHFLKKTSAKIFYAILDRIAQIKIARHVSDFRLIDRKALEFLKQCREKDLFLRGLVAWSGFESAFINFHQQDRLYGSSGYTWKKMFRLAFDALTGFSTFLLQFPLYLSLLMLTLSIITFFYGIFNFRIADSFSLEFLIWLINFFCIVFQCICLWLFAQILGRIYEEQKKRILYVYDNSINIPLINKSKGNFHDHANAL